MIGNSPRSDINPALELALGRSISPTLAPGAWNGEICHREAACWSSSASLNFAYIFD